MDDRIAINNSIAIIDYGTHKVLHDNTHWYCDSVYSVLSTEGVDRGLKMLKVAICLYADSSGGYFIGWF